MKIIRFFEDRTYNMVEYKAGTTPREWFSDSQAQLIVDRGEGEIIASSDDQASVDLYLASLGEAVPVAVAAPVPEEAPPAPPEPSAIEEPTPVQTVSEPPAEADAPRPRRVREDPQ